MKKHKKKKLTQLAWLNLYIIKNPMYLSLFVYLLNFCEVIEVYLLANTLK